MQARTRLRLSAGMAFWIFASAEAAYAADTLPLTIKPAQRVTLSYSDGRFSTRSITSLRGGPNAPPAPKDATQEYATPLDNFARKEPDDTLVFSFWSDATDGAQLQLENGLTRSIIYSAEIIGRDGRGAPTTICSVGNGKTGIESWVPDLAAVRITGIYDAPHGPMVCGYPERG
ncbi:MAG TPA: hypothetical protein VFW47_01155, partial [Phenylobacterium sp.]|nr:hypothetical protein [Phenylobacterium sp.]